MGSGVSLVEFRSGSWVVAIRGVAHVIRFIIFFVASFGAVGISLWGGGFVILAAQRDGSCCAVCCLHAVRSAVFF
jgi:hypothetical protein